MDKYLIQKFFFIFFASCTLLASCSNDKNTLNIAVASNFEKTLEQIIKLYLTEKKDNIKINVIAASSGLLTSQVLNKAPFDLFLSADLDKPALLQKKFKAQRKKSIYAIGKLALWIPDAQNDGECIEKLAGIKTLAIANPKTAPYGKLAQHIIQKANIKVDKIIQTTSISQAFLYTLENLTHAGFVAYPMLEDHNKGCIQIFEDNQLSQSMILLNDKAEGIYTFILSKKIQRFIQKSGYSILSTH